MIRMTISGTFILGTMSTSTELFFTLCILKKSMILLVLILSSLPKSRNKSRRRNQEIKGEDNLKETIKKLIDKAKSSTYKN